MFLTVERARLTGMWIIGTTVTNGSETLLYQDTSNVRNCSGHYVPSGLSVCSDIMTIPISGHHLVRFVAIYTANFLMLCEVQVFAGKTNTLTINIDMSIVKNVLLTI